MTGLSDLLVWSAAAATAAGFGLLVTAVARGWFARLRHGLRWALVCCLTGAPLVTAAALGAWGYTAARGVVFKEQLNALDAVAAAAETSVNAEIAKTLNALSKLAASRLAAGAAAASAAGDRAGAERQLGQLQAVNHHFLQIIIYDKDGNAV